MSDPAFEDFVGRVREEKRQERAAIEAPLLAQIAALREALDRLQEMLAKQIAVPSGDSLLCAACGKPDDTHEDSCVVNCGLAIIEAALGVTPPLKSGSVCEVCNGTGWIAGGSFGSPNQPCAACCNTGRKPSWPPYRVEAPDSGASEAVRAALSALGAEDATHAGFNLDGAIDDLERGKNDIVVRNTLRRVESQIGQAMRALMKALPPLPERRHSEPEAPDGYFAWKSYPPPRDTWVNALYDADGKPATVLTCKRGCCIHTALGCGTLPSFWQFATPEQAEVTKKRWLEGSIEPDFFDCLDGGSDVTKTGGA